MDFLSFIIGLGSGVLIISIAFLLFRSPKKQNDNQDDLNSRIRDLEIEASRIESARDTLSRENSELKAKAEELVNNNIQLNRDLATKSESLKNMYERLENQSKEMQETQKNLQSEFKNLDNEILEEKTKKFTEQNSKRLDEILHPFKEQIKGFEKRVEDTYEKTLKDQTDLQAELKKLQDMNMKISQEASNLTKALKGDVKKQGNWGEMILDKVLERSGLTKGIEYETQESFVAESGKRIQPDVVVHLPENKHILIDAKVSLVAYERYINAESTEEQAISLKLHLESVKKHVKELAEKSYQNTKGIQSPDFVLLFIPIEASFSIAVNEDPGLFNEAWSKHIVIVSPTTLLATLMTVASIWKQENQTRNALKIADEGAKLYDKFVHFLEDLDKLGKKLESASDHYKDSMKKLKTGPGNLISKVEGLKKLGVRSRNKVREIPESLNDFEPED
jgi:DNA recombination protein RmuC